ncbi:LemA family protein [Mycoplasma struthionis]|uniref:LemA family protein n=1 Tax=Mycoplasma struthionis TaxID=538220 RepID=A0A3G8LFN7_9MOLU|nr:LemA family protein [Mycoplasma struthionis]AZG68443.1 LemA family protein [Mycoplasma struthionis]TPI02817.1 LemA family protein [Mycoplasma struthionis]
MLFDTREKQNNEGFKPNVNNEIVKPTPTKSEKTIYVLFWVLSALTIIGLIIMATQYYSRKNRLLRKINDIQESSSLIQAAEKKRRATLLKQMDSVLSYRDFEKETITKVTELRSQLVSLENEESPVELNKKINSIQSGLNLQFENYPDLKASSLYRNFNTEIALQEDEIYTAIRLYNNKVNSFNSEIYTFWTNIIAAKNDMYNQPLFVASEKEREDVDTSMLRN